MIRPGRIGLDRANIEAALDASLKRLNTDYVDLYQLHWPDQLAPTFGQRFYTGAIDPEEVPIEETLLVLADLVKAGEFAPSACRTRPPGASMKFVALADALGLPRVVSIQNAYSLVNRQFETGLAEVACGKTWGSCPIRRWPAARSAASTSMARGRRHAHGAVHPLHPLRRRAGTAAIAKYVAIAREAGLDPSQMALAYVDAKNFVTSTIIRATSMDQLKADIAAFEIKLEDAVVKAIEAVHLESPDPVRRGGNRRRPAAAS